MDQGNSSGSPEAEKVTPAFANATPTPWAADPTEKDLIVHRGTQVARCERRGPKEHGRMPQETLANAAFIVHAVNHYASNAAELVKAYERMARMEADLNECLEFLADQMDVIDGDYGVPAPNRAMQLHNLIDETLNGRPV